MLPDDWVGVPRTTNIVKPEPVLGGRSVSYADHRQIQMQLDYDFGEGASRRRRPPLTEGQLPSLARFVANVWQTHPFREGNTRASAVFLELYLRSLGVEVDNSPFESHSCYFRDALVRASFSSIELGVDEDLSFLVRFLGNVALGQDNALEPGEMDVHGIRVDPGVEYRGGNPPLSQADRSPAPPRAERESGAAR